MKRFLLSSLGAAALLALSFAASQSGEFKKFMVAMQPKVRRAFEAGDTKFLESFTTDDFTASNGARTFSKEEWKAQAKEMFSGAQSIKADVKVLSATAKRRRGTAMTYAHIVLTMRPEASPDKKPHTRDLEMWLKETWVKSGKRWLLKHLEQARPGKMLIDGRPIADKKTRRG